MAVGLIQVDLATCQERAGDPVRWQFTGALNHPNAVLSPIHGRTRRKTRARGITRSGSLPWGNNNGGGPSCPTAAAIRDVTIVSKWPTHRPPRSWIRRQFHCIARAFSGHHVQQTKKRRPECGPPFEWSSIGSMISHRRSVLAATEHRLVAFRRRRVG